MQHCYALFLCFEYCTNTLNKILLKIKFSFKVKLRVPEYFSILKVEKRRRRRPTDVSTGHSGRRIFSIKAPSSQMPPAYVKWTKTIQERPSILLPAMTNRAGNHTLP